MIYYIAGFHVPPPGMRIPPPPLPPGGYPGPMYPMYYGGTVLRPGWKCMLTLVLLDTKLPATQRIRSSFHQLSSFKYDDIAGFYVPPFGVGIIPVPVPSGMECMPTLYNSSLMIFPCFRE